MNAKQRRAVVRETLGYFREMAKDQQEVELALMANELRRLEAENFDLRKKLMENTP
jgi:hypothetical protein